MARTGWDGTDRDRTRSDRKWQERLSMGRDRTGQDRTGWDGTDRDGTRSEREMQERTSIGRERTGLKSLRLTSSPQLFFHFARKTTSEVQLFA